MGTGLMTLAEKAILLDAISDAEHAGDRDEAFRLMVTLPLHPGMAKILKETYGNEHLLEGGYNLSEAYAEFGNDWLNK
jgi:hypothetical protein